MGGRSGQKGGGGGGNVSSEIIDAINGYQNKREYIDINGRLRDPNYDMLDLTDTQFKKKVRSLDDATTLSPLTQNTQLYRGSEINQYLSNKLKQGVGTTFSDKGFSSTSFAKTEITQNQIKFTINAKKGQKGIDVNKLNPNGKWTEEKEFILPRNTVFKITSIKKNEYGEYDVSLDII